jgi:hypothetical protein
MTQRTTAPRCGSISRSRAGCWWWQVLCLGSGHRGRVSQDMQDTGAPPLVTGRRAGRCQDVEGQAGHYRCHCREAPEPASFSSSRTWTSALSVPPPASSSANLPSTRTRTTSPPAGHLAGKRKHRRPNAGSRCPRCLATSQWWQVLGSNQRSLSRRFTAVIIGAGRVRVKSSARAGGRLAGVTPLAAACRAAAG